MEENQLHSGDNRIIGRDYIGDFVYADIDSAITTFAVVA